MLFFSLLFAVCVYNFFTIDGKGIRFTIDDNAYSYT